MKLKTILFFLLLAVGQSFAQFGASNIQATSANWGKCFTTGCAGGNVNATSATQTFGASSVISMTGPPFSDALFFYKLAGSTADPATTFSSDFTINLDSNGGTAQAFEYDLFQFVGGVEYMFGSQCHQTGTAKWQVWDQLHGAWVDTTLACSLSVSTDHLIQWAVHRVPGSAFMHYDILTIDGTPHAINMVEPAGSTTFADAIGIQFQLDEGAAGTSLSETLKLASFTADAPTVAGSISDDFSTGSLNARWCVDTGPAPANVSGKNIGTFSAENVDLTQGMLALKLTQSGSSPVTSVGAEVRSCQPLGFGSYEWTYRTASTATTPTGAGAAVSGSDSGGFNFINNSETEIDYETEGQFPNRIEMTNWQTTANKQYTQYTLVNPDQAFHKYRFDWSSSKIDFYIDGILVSTHTMSIPQTPAYAMMSIFGTNSTSFGGLATSGVARYLYVSKFTFTPSASGPAPPVGLAATIN